MPSTSSMSSPFEMARIGRIKAQQFGFVYVKTDLLTEVLKTAYLKCNILLGVEHQACRR